MNTGSTTNDQNKQRKSPKTHTFATEGGTTPGDTSWGSPFQDHSQSQSQIFEEEEIYVYILYK